MDWFVIYLLVSFYLSSLINILILLIIVNGAYQYWSKNSTTGSWKALSADSNGLKIVAVQDPGFIYFSTTGPLDIIKWMII